MKKKKGEVMLNKLAFAAFLVLGSSHPASWWSNGQVVVHQDPKSSDLQTGRTSVICEHEFCGDDPLKNDDQFLHVVTPELKEKERKKKEAEVALLVENQKKEKFKKNNRQKKEYFEENGIFFGCYDPSQNLDVILNDHGVSGGINQKKVVEAVSIWHKGERFGKQLQADLKDFITWFSKIIKDQD